jgi:hypothetical protein
LRRHELLTHGLVQQGRRQQTLVEQEVVEGQALEARAERELGLGAQLQQPGVAVEVGAGLLPR